MTELILLSLQGLATPLQEEELARWRQASPEHEARFRAVRSIWEGVEPVDPMRVREPVPTLRELQSRRARGISDRHRRRERRFQQGLRTAALLIVTALGAVHLSAPFRASPPEIQISEVFTGPNEMATAALPDGSVARLGPNSRIRSAWGGPERILEVDGRVFLSVTPDSTRPFIVRTANGEARVLGTRFEIDSRGDAMRVLVVEGAVAVRGDSVHEAVEVRAGERSFHRSREAPQVSLVPEAERDLSWMGAFAAFEKTPLRQVVRELELRLGIPIRLVDAAIGDRTVTGVFTEQERENVLELVCLATEVYCETRTDTVWIGAIE